MIKILRKEDYKTMPWKNGGGITHEVLKFPRDSNDWLWRISIAEVSTDGPFSKFPNFSRFLALLTGNGMNLNFDNSDTTINLSIPHKHIKFSGDENIYASLIDGANTDFNIIWDHSKFMIDMNLKQLTDSFKLKSTTQTSYLLYVLSGHLKVNNQQMIYPNEALYIFNNGDDESVLLEANGSFFKIQIDTIL